MLLGKNQRSAWPEVWLNVNLTWYLIPGDLGVHLTKDQPDQRSNTLGHKMSWGQIWPNVNLTWNLNLEVHLTESQPDLKIWKKSTWPETSSWEGVHLNKSQHDPKIWKKCLPDPKPRLWGSVWLSAKRTSENFNMFCLLGIASQMSFLQKTNNISK